MKNIHISINALETGDPYSVIEIEARYLVKDPTETEKGGLKDPFDARVDIKGIEPGTRDRETRIYQVFF